MSKNRIEVKDVDRIFYREQLEDFLPDKIIDIHTHVWQKDTVYSKASDMSRIQSWPSRVASENPVEDLIETYKLYFPNKTVEALIFSTIWNGSNFSEMNEYTSLCSKNTGLPGLALSRPEWQADELQRQIKESGLIGLKPYLTYAPDNIKGDDVTIFDFLPHSHLEMCDRNGWIVIMHIPRPGRLKDPANISQLLEIEQKYPNLKLVVAHVGRAYCMEDVGDALDKLKNTENMLFDISANTNADVFKLLIEAVGPKRILFGSDLPIARMRMRRITENGKYINIVTKGAYGDVSNDPHMREVEGDDAEKLTFFIYEEIAAFKRAAQATGLTSSNIADVFYNNASKILKSASNS